MKIAWQYDAAGRFIEMTQGAKKDYSMNWSDWLNAGDSVVTAVYVIPAGLTISDTEVESPVSRFVLDAVTVGVYSCAVTMTTANGLREVIRFRVVVQ
jgi:hypothetical protein